MQKYGFKRQESRIKNKGQGTRKKPRPNVKNPSVRFREWGIGFRDKQKKKKPFRKQPPNN